MHVLSSEIMYVLFGGIAYVLSGKTVCVPIGGILHVLSSEIMRWGILNINKRKICNQWVWYGARERERERSGRSEMYTLLHYRDSTLRVTPTIHTSFTSHLDEVPSIFHNFKYQWSLKYTKIYLQKRYLWTGCSNARGVENCKGKCLHRWTSRSRKWRGQHCWFTGMYDRKYSLITISDRCSGCYGEVSYVRMSDFTQRMVSLR